MQSNSGLDLDFDCWPLLHILTYVDTATRHHFPANILFFGSMAQRSCTIWSCTWSTSVLILAKWCEMCRVAFVGKRPNESKGHSHSPSAMQLTHQEFCQLKITQARARVLAQPFFVLKHKKHHVIFVFIHASRLLTATVTHGQQRPFCSIRSGGVLQPACCAMKPSSFSYLMII